MAKLKLKYVNEYIDRTGKLRRYFRKGGRQLGPLPGEVGSEEFMTAYAFYLAEKPAAAKRPPLHADSLAKLITDYYAHPWFTKRKPKTKTAYRSVLDPIMSEHGHRSVKLMTVENGEKMIGKIGETRPALANLTRAAMRRVFKLAIKLKRRGDNPFAGMEPYEVGEHHTWTDAELRQFERKWPLGSRERLAYALLLYTGQREGDVVRMNRADISGGLIHVLQEKGKGAELWLPIHPELERALKAYPAKGLTLIGDAAGRPFKTAPGLYRLMTKARAAAGLPARCVPHGLRKANQRLLAENGATEKEMQSMSGHTTAKETARYSKAASQKRLALAAIRKLKVPNADEESA